MPKARGESEVLKVPANNPVLINATFPQECTAKTTKGIKEKKIQRIPSSLQSQNSPLHLSSHALTQGKMALGEWQLTQTVQGTQVTLPHNPHSAVDSRWLKHYYRPENFSPPVIVWSPRAAETL